MALLAVEGTYKNGRVELAELPVGVEEAKVMVVFMASNRAKSAEETSAEREARRQAALARMQEGIDLGGPSYPKREELYDRFDR